MAQPQEVEVSRLFTRSDSWQDTVVSWQQQIEAVFGRASRRQATVPAARRQSSPEAGLGRPEAPADRARDTSYVGQ